MPFWLGHPGLQGLREDIGLLPSEWAAVVSELKKRPRPRSPSFTMPVAVMNTLAGLMSAGQGHGVGVGRAGLEGMGRGSFPSSVNMPLFSPTSQVGCEWGAETSILLSPSVQLPPLCQASVNCPGDTV